jgi:DNA-binding IclR family transcriptional regulator
VSTAQPADADVPAARSTGQSQSIAAVERALDVLLYFGRSPKADHGVTEVASELGLSKAAVHRILTSLRSRGLIHLDERTRRYSLGASALGLGRAYLDRQDVRALAAAELTWLSRESGETATLSIRTGDTRMYLDQVVPDREIRMEVSLGVPYPLHAGSSSKAFLAFMPDAEVDRYLARNGLTELTGETITDVSRLRRDLTAARRRGYTTSLGERQVGAGSIAAPVLNQADEPVAVISVSGPVERFKPEVRRCAELLLQATNRLSARMGHHPVR